MKILITPINGVTLTFKPEEINAVISLLEIILHQVEIPYVRDALNELQGRIRPKLTLVSHNHLCENCFRMVDDHGENAIHVTTEKVDKWIHRNCLPLKPESERER